MTMVPHRLLHYGARTEIKSTHTFLSMSSANVRKAFSMLMLALALVSKNLMPCSLAICREEKTKNKNTTDLEPVVKV